MSNFDFVLFVIAVIVLGLIVLSLIKLKTLSPLKVITRLQNNGAIGGIIAVIIFVIITAMVTFGYNDAKAESPTYLNYTEFFAGVDYEMGTNIFCYKDDVNDKLVSNVGVDQNLFTYKTVDINLKYQHHSCALNEDKPTYDAIGIDMKYRINWK